jgi:hypothetical protein
MTEGKRRKSLGDESINLKALEIRARAQGTGEFVLRTIVTKIHAAA